MEPCDLTFSDARRALDGGKLSSLDLLDSCLSRIGQADPDLSAFLFVADHEALRSEAADADERRARGGGLGPLDGIPVGVKDNISVAGMPLTCGSRILEGYVPPFDATAVARLRGGGAIIVGKTNMDEFAMGSSNEHSAFGPARNPWDPGRVPGGSSGGSAAAVAAGMCPLALGSDTGGSVRQPAGLCGVVGLKPSYGRVSRYGLVAFASSLDQIGALASDVEGAAVMTRTIAGHDPRDSTSLAERVPDYERALLSPPVRLRLGVPRELSSGGASPDVVAAVDAALEVLASLGAEIVEISTPHLGYGVAIYALVANAEASSNLARYDGVGYGARAGGAGDLDALYSGTRSEGFGSEVRRRIMLGTYALSAGYYDEYYLTAERARSLVAADFERAFREVDAVVGPTSPTTAFPLGERLRDPLAMYLADAYTVPANLAGVAAISVPCGLGADGMPVGLQITAPRSGEATMVAVAGAYEREAVRAGVRPRLAGGP